METKTFHTRGGATSCVNCGWGGIEVDDTYLSHAGKKRIARCPGGCAAPFDFWGRLVGTISDRSDLWHAVTLAGGYTTTFMESAPRDKQLSLELTDYGIPDGASIFKMLHAIQNQTRPTSGLTVFSHVTQKVGGKHLPPHITLMPVVIGGQGRTQEVAAEAVQEELLVSFAVVWAPNQMDTPAQGLLLSAFGAYGEGDMKRSLLDADSAVDISLKQLVDIGLKQLVKAELANGWPKKLPQLGFDQRLLVLTTLSRALGMTPLPAFILESVLELRSERNAVAHGSNEQVDAAKAAHLIAAALVAMNHFKKMLGEVA